MKRTALLSGLLSIAAAIGLLWLSAGCATAHLKGKIGDGKLEPATKAVVGLGASAAKIAAPEYAGAIDAVKDKIVGMGEESTAERMLTDAEFFAAAKRLGFGVSLVYRYKGAVVDGADVSWTWSADRSHTGADAVPPLTEEVAAAVSGESTGSEADIDARLDAAFERIAEKKKAK